MIPTSRLLLLVGSVASMLVVAGCGDHRDTREHDADGAWSGSGGSGDPGGGSGGQRSLGTGGTAGTAVWGTGGAGTGGAGIGGAGTGGLGSGGAGVLGGAGGFDPGRECVTDGPSSSCGPTFEEEIRRGCERIAVWPGPKLGSPLFGVRAGTCGSYRVAITSTGVDSRTCHYDADTGVLVGSRDCTDTPRYCGFQTWCIRGGPPLESCNLATLPRLCPAVDAGSD